MVRHLDEAGAGQPRAEVGPPELRDPLHPCVRRAHLRSKGYTVALNAPYAGEVQAQIQAQAPDVAIYASATSTGLAATVQDNRQNGNRATSNIVEYLQAQGLHGITIEAETTDMDDVPELVSQLGPSFKSARLGIVVSVPWPARGPADLYGDDAVAVFNEHVDALELQDYSSLGTPEDVRIWTKAGVKAELLMGGVSTENGTAQTSLENTAAWTRYALEHGLRGMNSWRLSNDHGLQGENEDVQPTFTGAKMIYDTVQSYGKP